jgi:dienelactone hydrolase
MLEFEDVSRVGIMGFSAGGHLASTAATDLDSGNPYRHHRQTRCLQKESES